MQLGARTASEMAVSIESSEGQWISFYNGYLAQVSTGSLSRNRVPVTVYGAVRLSLHGFIVECLHGTCHNVRCCQIESPRVHCHVFTWYLPQCTALSYWVSTGSLARVYIIPAIVYGAVRLSLHGFIVTCLLVPDHSVRRCQVEPPRVYCHVFTGTSSQCTALSGWATTGLLSRVY